MLAMLVVLVTLLILVGIPAPRRSPAFTKKRDLVPAKSVLLPLPPRERAGVRVECWPACPVPIRRISHLRQNTVWTSALLALFTPVPGTAPAPAVVRLR